LVARGERFSRALKRLPAWVFTDGPFILALFVGSRLVLETIGIVSRQLLDPIRPRPAEWSFSASPFLDLWGVWDTGWFVGIADGGYVIAPDASGQANYAFLPLYPLLMRWVGKCVGGSFNGGLVVSNICLLVACVLLFDLVALDEGPESARRAVKYLLLLPAGFVFSGAFTEATFLALVLGAFVAVRRDRLLLAGACGFLAAFTRPLGVLLVLPLALLSVAEARRRGLRPSPGLLFLLLVPLGLGCFSLFLAFRTGDPLAFIHVQAAWGRGFASPWAVLSWGLHHADASRRFAAWMTILTLGIVVASLRRLGAAYGVYSLYSILIPLSTGLTSMPRYVLAIFPLAFVFSRLSRDARADTVLTVSLALVQGFLMVFWVSGFFLVV
jgi:hypothetical protein